MATTTAALVVVEQVAAIIKVVADVDSINLGPLPNSVLQVVVSISAAGSDSPDMQMRVLFSLHNK